MDLSQDTRVFLSVQDRWMEQKTEQMPGGSFSVNEHNRLKGQSFQSTLGQDCLINHLGIHDCFSKYMSLLVPPFKTVVMT